MAGVVHGYSVCTVPAVVCAGVHPVASRVSLGTCMGAAKCGTVAAVTALPQSGCGKLLGTWH